MPYPMFADQNGSPIHAKNVWFGLYNIGGLADDGMSAEQYRQLTTASDEFGSTGHDPEHGDHSVPQQF